ncbi:MAG: hypothetical protein M5U15_12605 [Kiritimatiellae bacterium]|nr:hypothetical protein [Kiritimatiellia bacterium]
MRQLFEPQSLSAIDQGKGPIEALPDDDGSPGQVKNLVLAGDLEVAIPPSNGPVILNNPGFFKAKDIFELQPGRKRAMQIAVFAGLAREPTVQLRQEHFIEMPIRCLDLSLPEKVDSVGS